MDKDRIKQFVEMGDDFDYLLMSMDELQEVKDAAVKIGNDPGLWEVLWSLYVQET